MRTGLTNRSLPLRSVAARCRRVLAVRRQSVDAVRVREHLRRAETDLRSTDGSHLSAAERERREQRLDELREYWRRGEFPTNRESSERTPCFRGANGTPCAMAALLLADGRDDLVEHVAERENTLRIEDVEDGPLLSWLDANGLTRAEAARIQPSYAASVEFATDCGPLSCRLAGLLVSLVGFAVFAAAEYVGYRYVSDLFPDNALKRRGALGYITVMNAFLAPLLALLLFALFP